MSKKEKTMYKAEEKLSDWVLKLNRKMFFICESKRSFEKFFKEENQVYLTSQERWMKKVFVPWSIVTIFDLINIQNTFEDFESNFEINSLNLFGFLCCCKKLLNDEKVKEKLKDLNPKEDIEILKKDYAIYKNLREELEKHKYDSVMVDNFDFSLFDRVSSEIVGLYNRYSLALNMGIVKAGDDWCV